MNTHRRPLRLLLVLTALFLFLLTPAPARADIAPPESPPGGNPAPEGEHTQVRMLAETVTLVVVERPPRGSLGQARVTAVFEMQNTGTLDETLQVRFPLTFPNGRSDGFGNFPEIGNLQVRVAGRTTPTQRITTENPGDIHEDPLPWAAFPATFPAGESVQVEVSYLAEAWGEYPYLVFGYVLETGAGWQGTIGKAELVVRLPYEVNEQNVILQGSVGFGGTSPGAELAGNELRWQRTDFEPNANDNLSVLVLSPEAWKKVLAERAATSRNPRDGEAWGRLGKACKEASRLRRGFREDPGGMALFQESLAAYQKAVELLPEDALWHYGYAELLWSHYIYHLYSPYEHDQSELVQAVRELKASLELDPDEPRALALAQEMAWLGDGIIDLESEPIVYSILTATPVYPSREPLPETIAQTASPEPTITLPPPSPTSAAPLPGVAPTATPLAVAQAPAAGPDQPYPTEIQGYPAGWRISPLCSGAFIAFLSVSAIWRSRSRSRSTRRQ